MLRYILKRLLLAVPTILGAVTVVFFSMHLAPGDPASLFIPPDLPPERSEELIVHINEKYGFDQPLHIQYFRYLSNLARLDFGTSLREGRPVSQGLAQRIPFTLQLGLTALAISTVVGITIGSLAAIYRGRTIDHVVMAISLLGVSIPGFWLGLTLILLFAVRLRWVPPSGIGESFWSWDGMRHLILPVSVLALGSIGSLARYTRSCMLEVINNDYVRTARAKGQRERLVVVRHVLRNALVPIVTIIGLDFGFVLSGAVITETLFAWPGIGRYLIEGVNGRDFPVVQGAVLLIATAFVIGNLIADIALVYVDPRVRLE